MQKKSDTDKAQIASAWGGKKLKKGHRNRIEKVEGTSPLMYLSPSVVNGEPWHCQDV